MTEPVTGRQPRIGSAGRVAAGILTSRVFGIVRDVTVAFFFGVGAHLDVFRTAFRAPNIIQTLLGEQSLSASLIPIYSRFLEEGRKEDARRFAGATFGLVLAAAATVALAGMIFARPLVTLTTPGFVGDAARVAADELSVDRFELAVTAIRILFPMTAFFALSAWTLCVLNSHRRFFLPYVAPVLWNTAIIGSLLYVGWEHLPAARLPQGIGADAQSRILVAGFFGGLLGGGLQFLAQLPLALRLLGGFRPSFALGAPGVRTAIRNFAPAVAARGAAQLSSYLDMVLASLLAAGAPAALGLAQTIYLVPMALFAGSIAAAELPELSRRVADSAGRGGARASKALRQITFFVVPAQVGFIAFGLLIVGALFRRGRFELADNWLVYLILAVYTLGMLPSSWSKLLSNVFFAEGDTRTPARYSVQRMALSALVGGAAMLWCDRFAVGDLVAGVGPKGETLFLGGLGLAAGSVLGAYYEVTSLRRVLRSRGSEIRWPVRFAAACLLRALATCALALGLWLLTERLAAGLWLPLRAILVVGAYGSLYMLLSKLQRVEEAEDLSRTLGRGSSKR